MQTYLNALKCPISLLRHMSVHLLSRRAKIAELSSSIQRQETTLKTLNLPDGGAQLRARISQQRTLLAELTAEGPGEDLQSVISWSLSNLAGKSCVALWLLFNP